MEIFQQQIEPQGIVNINILNSLVLLFANAMRPEELEHKVLPLFSKHRIKEDVFTYQTLAKLNLNLRELDKAIELCRKSPTVTVRILEVLLECGLRKEKDGSDIICEALEKYVEIKRKPNKFLLKKLAILSTCLIDYLYS